MITKEQTGWAHDIKRRKRKEQLLEAQKRKDQGHFQSEGKGSVTKTRCSNTNAWKDRRNWRQGCQIKCSFMVMESSKQAARQSPGRGSPSLWYSVQAGMIECLIFVGLKSNELYLVLVCYYVSLILTQTSVQQAYYEKPGQASGLIGKKTGTGAWSSPA